MNYKAPQKIANYLPAGEIVEQMTRHGKQSRIICILKFSGIIVYRWYTGVNKAGTPRYKELTIKNPHRFFDQYFNELFAFLPNQSYFAITLESHCLILDSDFLQNPQP